ncbi:MAG: hypothetical protein WCF78_01775 [archaeon]
MKKKCVFLLIAVIVIIISVLIFLFCTGPSEKRVNQEIKNANFCFISDDCLQIDGSCPFGCTILINKNEETRIRDLIFEYHKNKLSLSTCVYDCPVYDRPQFKSINCVDNKCVPQHWVK